MIKTLTKNFALVAMLILSFSVMAQTVVISEIGFKSSASNEDYVELFNSTGSAINLTGYTLVPSTGSTVTLNTTIPANGFYVIGKNATEVAFEAAWGVLIGGTSVYQNSNTNLSTTAGVTFSLRNASSTEIDNTTGYGITLGTRLYQCPVGSFLGNTLDVSETNCTPGGVSALSVDDLSHWTISRFNDSWNVGIVSSSTSSDNFILKNSSYYPNSSDQIHDVYLPNYSFIRTTNNNLTISGDLIINDEGSVTVTGTGSVTVTGTIYQNRIGANTDTKYNLWTTPFSSVTDILNSFSGINPCDVYTYQATIQEWKSDYSVPFSTTCNGNSVTFTSANVISSPEGVADGDMDIGRGYFLPGSASSTKRTLTGSAFNNGDINTPIYGSSVAVAGGNDWNLIGNPYPSGIQSSAFISNTNNASLFNAAYIYVGTGGYYTSVNASSTGFYIASCQGFFVNATTTTDGLLGNAQFRNSMRVPANWDWRNSNQTIYISLNDGHNNDQIQVILDANSEDDLDSKHDAYKLANPNNLNLATFIDSELFVFNGVKPIKANQTKTIKMHVQTPDSGNYTINIDSLNLIGSNIEVILEDKANNTFTNLKNISYTFSTTQSEIFNNRFFLHLTNNVTSVNQLANELNVSIYSANNVININSIGETTITRVEVYDVLGKNIYSSNKSLDNHVVNVRGYQSGIYFVKVYGENGKLTAKRIFID
jgi:hypothetical protein